MISPCLDFSTSGFLQLCIYVFCLIVSLLSFFFSVFSDSSSFVQLFSNISQHSDLYFLVFQFTYIIGIIIHKALKTLQFIFLIPWLWVTWPVFKFLTWCLKLKIPLELILSLSFWLHFGQSHYHFGKSNQKPRSHSWLYLFLHFIPLFHFFHVNLMTVCCQILPPEIIDLPFVFYAAVSASVFILSFSTSFTFVILQIYSYSLNVSWVIPFA